ncbi:MAG: amino acid adenylation domain-containing protein, partial [Pseudonocardia sp.]|nr:amino acid adenylation domain-containing protein [Pseudonocardia sp.]
MGKDARNVGPVPHTNGRAGHLDLAVRDDRPVPRHRGAADPVAEDPTCLLPVAPTERIRPVSQAADAGTERVPVAPSPRPRPRAAPDPPDRRPARPPAPPPVDGTRPVPRHVAEPPVPGEPPTRRIPAVGTDVPTVQILAVYPENAATMRIPVVPPPPARPPGHRRPVPGRTVRPSPRPRHGAHRAATQRLRTPSDLAIYPTPAPRRVRTLLDIVESAAERHPAAPALDDGRPVTYRELMQRVQGVAAMLRSSGVAAGDRVGVRMSSGTTDLYLAILGVLAAGGAYVPVDADDPDDRAETIWEEADVRGVLGDGMAFTPRSTAHRRVVSRRPTPDDDAWIIFTSGSTGKPKGVAISHRSAAAFVDAEADLFLRNAPLGPGDRVLAGLSVAFDASCEEMWLAWRYGACLVPAPRRIVRAGAELGPWLIERAVTVVSTVPTLAALWPSEALDRVRLLIFGGEACPPELVERLAAPDREVWNTYGPTEATVVACAAPLVPGEPVRIGLPLHGWQLAVVDPQGDPVRRGETGELVIGGAGLGRYLDRAKDAEKYRPVPALGWTRAYYSGDLVSSDEHGLLFVGRADDQVKLGGRRIELGEIDAALLALPRVTAAAAAVKKTKAGGEILVGYLAVEGDGPDLAEARAALAERLPAALVPVLAVVDTIPTRTSGKVDRKALPWPPPGQEDAAGSGAGPAADLPGTAGWLARAWHEILAVPIEEDADFFALGGNSLATATLLSVLRERHATIAISDIYQRPTLGELAAFLDQSSSDPVAGAAAPAEPVTVPRTRFWTALAQFVILMGTQIVTGLRWALGLALLHNLASSLLHQPLAEPVPWWIIITGYLVLLSAPGKVLVVTLGVRFLRLGVRPGNHPRGGRVHLQLWACERLAMAFGVRSLDGTRWAALYARALGCRVGRNVDLRTTVPVTGWAAFGDNCAVEPETDLAGWWIEADTLHLGTVEIGEGARVGGRSILMPGARVGAGAVIEAGTCVTDDVPEREVWAGSPAQCVGIADGSWPAPVGRRSFRWTLVYTASLFGLGWMALLAAVPWMLMLGWVIRRDVSLKTLVLHALAVAPVGMLTSVVLYATMFALTVRVVSRWLKPGFHKVDSRAGWAAWLVESMVDGARATLFPLYAGLITPFWLRRLGATIGRHVEASTVTGLPRLMRADDGSFLADDTQVAPYETGGGWVLLGEASVGERSFVGNSGIVGPGRRVPDHSLVAVLSSAPAHAEVGTSWLGRPAMELPRVAETGDLARTFAPPRRLVVARALVESMRVLPWLIMAVLGVGVLTVFEFIRTEWGWGVAAAAAGLVMFGAGLVAALVTTAAKWLLVGRFREGQHPLWSSFVWRNELFDVFYEELGVPWFGGPFLGTPMFNAWVRTLGVKVGKGVWLESYWLPETDLVRLGDGATVNRGCVLQTHLFHDRLLRISSVQLARGATLGPRSFVLPGASIGAGARIGPGS